MAIAPRAQARLVPGDDRWSLVEEAALATDPSSIIDSNTIRIPTWGYQWVSDSRYVLDDMGVFVAIARSSLGADITRSNGFQPFDCADWSKLRIDGLVIQNGAGWGGQCLSFISLLLLRSGCVSDQQILISYDELEGASKDIHRAQPGDVAFRNVYRGLDSHGNRIWDRHTAVVMKVDNSRGILFGDSNYDASEDERIRMHYLIWKDLDRLEYKAADLDALIGYLHHQNRQIALCQGDSDGTSPSSPCASGSMGISALRETPTDTRIDILAGQQLTIHASGMATYGLDSAPCGSGVMATDPDGGRFLAGTSCGSKSDPASVLPTAPIGALLGRIGSGPWFVVGSNYSGVASSSGRLFLLYNDDPGYYSDNGGGYSADITVCGGGTAGSGAGSASGGGLVFAAG